MWGDGVKNLEKVRYVICERSCNNFEENREKNLGGWISKKVNQVFLNYVNVNF